MRQPRGKIHRVLEALTIIVFGSQSGVVGFATTRRALIFHPATQQFGDLRMVALQRPIPCSGLVLLIT